MTIVNRSPFRILLCLGLASLWLGATGTTAEPRCTCRFAGQSYVVGTCVCMSPPGGEQQRVCCGMVLNNTSWDFTGQSCPIAQDETAAPAAAPGRLAAHVGRPLEAAAIRPSSVAAR